MKDNKCTGSPYMWTTTTTTTKITLQSFLRPPSLPTWRSSSFLIGLMVKSTFCIKKQKTKQKQNKKTKDNNNNKQKTNKQTKQLYRRIQSIKVPYPSKTPSLAESNLCKKSPTEFNYYLSSETIHVLVMSEACVVILFAYKWLYSFVKALDEIKKKCKLFWFLLLAVWNH